MIKNSLMKFIDSCVGNIARKIEDEFRESDHPRDKGGKFTSKGGEGHGGGNGEEHDEVMSSVRNIMNRALSGNPRDPIMRKRAQKELRKALSKESSSKPMNISVSAGGDTEGLEAEAKKYGVKAKLGKSSHGETPVKLSGAKEDIRRYLEEKFYGSEEEAREFSPEAYENSSSGEHSSPDHIEYMKNRLEEGLANNPDVGDEILRSLGADSAEEAYELIEKDPETAWDNLGAWVDEEEVEWSKEDKENPPFPHEQEEDDDPEADRVVNAIQKYVERAVEHAHDKPYVRRWQKSEVLRGLGADVDDIINADSGDNFESYIRRELKKNPQKVKRMISMFTGEKFK